MLNPCQVLSDAITWHQRINSSRFPQQPLKILYSVVQHFLRVFDSVCMACCGPRSQCTLEVGKTSNSKIYRTRYEYWKGTAIVQMRQCQSEVWGPRIKFQQMEYYRVCYALLLILSTGTMYQFWTAYAETFLGLRETPIFQDCSSNPIQNAPPYHPLDQIWSKNGRGIAWWSDSLETIWP